MLAEPGVERGWYHDRKPEFGEFQSLFAGSGTKALNLTQEKFKKLICTLTSSSS